MAKRPKVIPPFNPLDKTNLGESVAEAMLQQPIQQLPLAESLLVEMYCPLWNQKIDGFGNHDPGKGRYNQQRSAWDIIHPGRAWANKLPPPSSDECSLREGAAVYIARNRNRIIAQMNSHKK